MTAPREIYQLVETFERNADDYRSSGYNETQARQEFINPLFRLLLERFIVDLERWREFVRLLGPTLFLVKMKESRVVAVIGSVARRDDFPKIIIQQTRDLPICSLDLGGRKDKARHDRLTTLVEQIQTYHHHLAAAKTPHEKTSPQTQIAATDREIDRLVYELYGLTEEEIRIVEEGTGKN